MPSNSFWSAALLLAGLANANPINPQRRAPSYAPAPSVVVSLAPLQIQTFVSVAPVPSAPASVLPGGYSLSTPASTPPAPPAPTATWSIKVEVGSTNLDIGNADPSTFEGLWSGACGDVGCDAGSPVSFDFMDDGGAGRLADMSGTFTMEGNYANPDWKQSLLDVVTASALASVQCQGKSVQVCALKRETPAVALGCDYQTVNICTMVNYVQATMYNEDNLEMAQMTMKGEDDASDFPCDAFLGTINAAATAVDVAPPVAGGLALVQVICDALAG